MKRRLWLWLLIGMVLSITQAQADDSKVMFSKNSLTPETALKVAKSTLDSCRKAGFQVSVAVIDSGGIPQVMLRDRLAGMYTPDVAVSKARAAVNFKTSTTTLVDELARNPEVSGVKHIPGILVVGGGILIQASGSIVGAIGVSGAPSGKLDEKCAEHGLEAIQDSLDFAD